MVSHSRPSSKRAKLPLTIQDVLQARARIVRSLQMTPLTHSPVMSELAEVEVWFKWDNKLRTGSFKERGALNALLTLSAKDKKRGVCAVSAGNHALALSYHAAQLKIPCCIVMPAHAPLVKVQSTRNTGAEVILHGTTLQDAREYTQQLSEVRKLKLIPPFDDLSVIAGQGTAGLEIMDQLADFDSLIVPVGGGGLISGIATAVKALRPKVFVMGVESEWAVTMRSGKAPAGFFAPITIADGIAVNYTGEITTKIMPALVDSFVTVSEPQIANAVMRFLDTERTVIEGAGAAGLAALLAGKLPKRLKKVVVMACGSNIDVNLLSRLIEKDMGAHDRLLRVFTSIPDRPGALSALAALIARNGANVLQVGHDRSVSSDPGNVDVTFSVEVRDRDHKRDLLKNLKKAGINASELKFS